MLTLRIPQTTVEYKYIIIHMEILGYSERKYRVVFVCILTSDLSRSTLFVNS